ncbi:hypothetical protein CMQ_6156 [Grosmannia clavigera kw1407]|uniref:Uncharacterized protein n=1 Tax=Grosmannia clavigera (strain kw1407 / UAMH 11150) TaxID=655863 RepID=F0XMU7_GROCL|nr:uncharacterized protein CMQ_6156 [Grosmannia clavigera kw1407]EFX01214.1 hypothetical protein CMQ_6156 [Grosmannia clavigera kw1407]
MDHNQSGQPNANSPDAAARLYYMKMMRQTLQLYGLDICEKPLPNVFLNYEPRTSCDGVYQDSDSNDGNDNSGGGESDEDSEYSEESDEPIYSQSGSPVHHFSPAQRPAATSSARTDGYSSMDMMQVPCLSADTDALVAGTETSQSAAILSGLPTATTAAVGRRHDALQFGLQVVQQLGRLDVLPRLQRLRQATHDLLERVQAARPPATTGHQLHDTATAVLQQAVVVAAEARRFLTNNLAAMVATAVAAGNASTSAAQLEGQLQHGQVTMRSGHADTVYVDRLDDVEEPVFLDREDSWEVL